MQKLDKEEIYHLIDFLEINIQEAPNKRLLSKNKKSQTDFRNLFGFFLNIKNYYINF